MEICRACLVTKHNMIPLNEAFIQSYNLLTNLNVALQDGMPQYLCPNCALVVRSFIEFREKSILSETTLREELEDTKPKDEVMQTVDNINISLKQEVKSEDDSIFNEYLDEPTCYQEEIEPQFSFKIKKEPVTKQIKHKKSTKSQRRKNTIIKPKKHVSDTTAERILSCGICKKHFEGDSDLKSHLHMHMKYRECEICHERFSGWPGLLSHRLEHIPNKKGHCHLCNKRFVSSIYLEHHYLTAHNDGQQKALKCKICQHAYKTPKQLCSHLNLSHTEARFFCDYCSKGFTCKSNLRTHLRTHSDNKSIVCDLCGFQCTQKKYLKIHKLRKHTPNTTTCKNCNVVLTSQKQRDSHTCSINQVTCPDCGKMVSSKKIGRHLKTHKAASYKCTRCSATYKTRTALRVHTDRHDGVRRVQCDLCPAKFFSQTVLIKHRRIHTGEKPYVCKICSKAFTGGNNLKVHMKVHGIFSIVKKDSTTAENITDIFKKYSA